MRAAFAPGTKFSYSSEGLTYLQMVVEHLLGMPLAMERTVLKEESRADLPPMLRFLEGSLLANGALSLRTTVTDYARFMGRYVGHWPGGNEMLRAHIPVTSVPGLYWGLGWGVQDTGSIRRFWHWGARSTPNTMSFVMGIPSQQRAIVIFTNPPVGCISVGASSSCGLVKRLSQHSSGCFQRRSGGQTASSVHEKDVDADYAVTCNCNGKGGMAGHGHLPLGERNDAAIDPEQAVVYFEE